MTKFFRSLRIRGRVTTTGGKPHSLNLRDPHKLKAVTAITSSSVDTSGKRYTSDFEIDCLRSTEVLGDDVFLECRIRRGGKAAFNLIDLCNEKVATFPGPSMFHRFRDEVNANNFSVLDIGGRDRSGVARRGHFDVSDYVVVDVLPGENVDVVGDAHVLSDLFPGERFDAFFSVSVFEHLMMPWAVVPQINKVLRTGGIGMIATHQTLGMHDIPWDFWRFSEYSWDALFNDATGFEIVEKSSGFEQHVIPFVYRPGKEDAELAAGFELVQVWVRKIGPCRMSWNMTPGDVTTTAYPSGVPATG